MNNQAYINGFKYKCSELGVDPAALVKNASWITNILNNTSSRFDSDFYKKYLGRTVKKGRYFPFIFPKERRFDVHPGDTYESASGWTGVPVDKLIELNEGKPLIAGSYFRVQ